MRTSIVALLGAGVFVLATSAAAHDPLRVVAPLAAEGGSEPALLRTNRGLVFMSGEGFTSVPSGTHLCHAALGAHPSELLPAVPMPGGGWVVATSRGISIVSAAGCEGPTRSELMGVGVQDLAAHPSLPGALYAVTADVASGSGLYSSGDGGLSFEPVLVLGADEYLSSLEISPADPSRIYLAGSSYARDSRSVSHWVLVHTAGLEPARYELTLAPSEPRARIGAAHPTDVDTFALHVSASQVGQVARDRLLLSRDGGATIATWHEAPSIGQLAFSPDGRSAWLTSADGLQRSDDFGPFVSVPLERGPSSVTWINEQLYVGDSIGLSVSGDRGRSFQPLFHFWDVLQPATCDAAVIEACRQDWDDLSREMELAREAVVATTTPGALPTTGGDPPQPSRATAGCALPAPQKSNPLALLLAVAGLASSRRRSRP